MLFQTVISPSNEEITKWGSLIVTVIVLAQYVLPKLKKNKHSTDEMQALVAAIGLSENERDKMGRRITLLEARIKLLGGSYDDID